MIAALVSIAAMANADRNAETKYVIVEKPMLLAQEIAIRLQGIGIIVRR